MEQVSRRHDRHKRIIRFIITGGSAAAVEYATFIGLHGLGLHIIVANSLSFCCGLVVSFSLNKFWVFKSKADATVQFGMYAILAIINLIISDTFIWVAVNKLSLHALIAKLIAMVLIAAWNYGIYAKFIFKHQTPVSD